MVYVGENVYKCTLYLCNVSKFKKCRKKGCNFQIKKFVKKDIDECLFTMINQNGYGSGLFFMPKKEPIGVESHTPTKI